MILCEVKDTFVLRFLFYLNSQFDRNKDVSTAVWQSLTDYVFSSKSRAVVFLFVLWANNLSKISNV